MPAIVPLLVSAVGAAVSAGVAVVTGSLVVGALVSAVVTTGLGLAFNSVLGNRKKSPNLSLGDRVRAVKDNVTSNVASIPVIYGTARVGGNLIYANTAGSSNKFLYMVLCLTEGEISAVNKIFIDGKLSTDAQLLSYTQTSVATGKDTQSVPSFMLEAPEWTTNDTLNGLAYVALKLTANSEVFPRIPSITAEVDGMKVYDPRNGNTVFTHNPALCIRDYLIDARYGRAIPLTQIDDQSFTDAANYCDQLVTLPDATTQARYTLDGVVLTNQSIMDNLKEMLSSCRGWLVMTGGTYKLLIDKPETVLFSFNEDNIIGAWTIQRVGKRNRKNKIEAHYVDPDKDYETDLVLLQDPTYLIQDNSVELSETIELPFTTNRARAQQIAQMTLKQTRQDILVQFKATIAALQVEVGNVVTISHTTPGWVNKQFRVTEIRLESTDEVSITAISYDASVYSLDNVNDFDVSNVTTLEDPFSIQPPGVPAISQQTYVDTNNKTLLRVLVSWYASTSPFVQDYQVEYKLSSDATWILGGKTVNLTIFIDDLPAGVYDFRVKATNTLGFSSDYSQVVSREIVNVVTTPSDITQLRGDVNNTNIKLKWTQHPDSTVTSGGAIVIRHSSKTSGAAWSDPVNFESRISGDLVETTLPYLQGTYMVKAENLASIQSLNPALLIVDINEAENAPAILSLAEDPSYLGTKIGMVSSGGFLILDGLTLFDSQAGNFDAVLGAFDDIGGYLTTGSYIFSTTPDLGRVYFVRLKKSFNATFSDLSTNVDGRAGVFDDQTGLFDGDSPTNINVKHYYRTTNTDPAGSPTWSAWQEFSHTETKGRGFQFKIVVETSNTQQNIYINALSAALLMENRATSASNLSVLVTGNTITYNKAFYQQPKLSVIIKNQQSGDYPIISGESSTGFSVLIKDKTDTAVARTIDWIATGIGEETL